MYRAACTGTGRTVAQAVRRWTDSAEARFLTRVRFAVDEVAQEQDLRRVRITTVAVEKK
jgi:hypothetical protein